MKQNWIKYIDKSTLNNFLYNELNTSVGIISPCYEEHYGKAYVCMFYSDMSDVSGIDGCTFKLGNFGGVKSQKNGLLIDDFDFMKKSPDFIKNYVLMVAKSNIIDGKPRRINGLTYGDCFVNRLKKHIDSLKKKWYQLDYSQEKQSDYRFFKEKLVEFEILLSRIEGACENDEKNL